MNCWPWQETREKRRILFERRIVNTAVEKRPSSRIVKKTRDGASLLQIWFLGIANGNNGLVWRELRGEYLVRVSEVERKIAKPLFFIIDWTLDTANWCGTVHCMHGLYNRDKSRLYPWDNLGRLSPWDNLGRAVQNVLDIWIKIPHL